MAKTVTFGIPGLRLAEGDHICAFYRGLEERDEILILRKDEIRRQIAEGVASLRAGRGVDGEAVFDRIEAELDALERDDRG